MFNITVLFRNWIVNVVKECQEDWSRGYLRKCCIRNSKVALTIHQEINALV